MQREKIQSRRNGDKRFEGKGGCECCISRGEATWARLSNGGIQAGGVRGGSHTAGRCGISKKSRDAAGRAAPGVKFAMSSEFSKGE